MSVPFIQNTETFLHICVLAVYYGRLLSAVANTDAVGTCIFVADRAAHYFKEDGMIRRSIGITILGYGLLVVYGAGLLIYLMVFIISLFEPKTASHFSMLFKGLWKAGEFQKQAMTS